MDLDDSKHHDIKIILHSAPVFGCWHIRIFLHFLFSLMFQLCYKNVGSKELHDLSPLGTERNIPQQNRTEHTVFIFGLSFYGPGVLFRYLNLGPFIEIYLSICDFIVLISNQIFSFSD